MQTLANTFLSTGTPLHKHEGCRQALARTLFSPKTGTHIHGVT